MFDYSSIPHPLGLATTDLALLAGGISLLAAVVILGISGNKRGRRWLARFGWLVLMISVAALGYGTIKGNASASAQDQP